MDRRAPDANADSSGGANALPMQSVHRGRRRHRFARLRQLSAAAALRQHRGRQEQPRRRSVARHQHRVGRRRSRRRTKETNKLIIHENETRNVGVIQHNHRIIEKEIRYVKRAPVYRHHAPAPRVRVQTVSRAGRDSRRPAAAPARAAAVARRLRSSLRLQTYVYAAPRAYARPSTRYVAGSGRPLECRRLTPTPIDNSPRGGGCGAMAVRRRASSTRRGLGLVEPSGIEPLTSSLRTRRSPS